MTDTLRKLTHSQIHPSPQNVRRDVGDITDLAISIYGSGLQQPMIVRVAKNGDGYELIAGERRWTAIGQLIADGDLAADTQFPTIVRSKVDDTQQQIAMLVENIQRVDLDPVDEMLAFVKLRDVHNMSIAEIARATGVSDTTIRSRLSWASFPDEFLDRIGDDITIGVANKLGEISDQARAKLLKKPGTVEVHKIENAWLMHDQEMKATAMAAALTEAGHIVVSEDALRSLMESYQDQDWRVEHALDPEMTALNEVNARAQKINEDFCVKQLWKTYSVADVRMDLLEEGTAPLLVVVDHDRYRVSIKYLTHTKTHGGNPLDREDDDDDESATDYDIAWNTANVEYTERREAWHAAQKEAKAQFLNAKPAELVKFALTHAVARNYGVNNNSEGLRTQLGLTDADLPLIEWAQLSAKNLAKVATAIIFNYPSSDVPGFDEPAPTSTGYPNEDHYDEDGKYFGDGGPNPEDFDGEDDPEISYAEALEAWYLKLQQEN